MGCRVLNKLRVSEPSYHADRVVRSVAVRCGAIVVNGAGNVQVCNTET